MEGKSSRNQNQNIVDKASGPNDTAREVGYPSSLPPDTIDRRYRLNNQLNMESMSAEDAGNAPASAHANEFKNAAADACIRDIFSQSNGINRLGEYLKVFPGVTSVRNRVKIVSGKPGPRDSGKKMPIRTFSPKSRRSMMITLAMLEEPLKFWQDFTFADDVMQGLTIAQRAKYSSRCLKNFKQWMDRAGLKIHGIWKREWVKRKSGELRGQYVPHYHIVYTLPDMDRETYSLVAIKIARQWVKFTGTQTEAKALAVALHPNSSRFIESRKQMQKYMSKYLVKDGLTVFAESIGRNWGVIGSPQMAEGEVIEVSEKEMVLFKRCLRKIAKRITGFFKVALNKEYTKFFMLIEGSTVIRYFEWLRVHQSFEGVPF